MLRKHDRHGIEEAGAANKLGSLPTNLSTLIARSAGLRAISGSDSDIVRE